MPRPPASRSTLARRLAAAERVAQRHPVRALGRVRALLAARPSEAERSRVYEALRAIASSLSGHDAIEAWLLLSDDAWQAGRPTTAEEAVAIAERAARALDDRRALGSTQLARARQLAARSRYREALARVAEGLETVRERELDLEARLHVLHAAIASHTLSPEAARHARRAVLIASELGDEALHGASLAQLGIALVERGIHGEGRDVLSRALAIARARHDPHAECRAQLYLSMLELDSGRPLVAQRCVAAALPAARRSQSRIATGFALGSSGVVQLVRRHPVAAARDLAQAEVLLDEVGDRHARATFLAFLGAAEAMADRRAEASARFADARAMLRPDDEARYPRVLVEVLSSLLTRDDVLATLTPIEAGPVYEGWADVRVACRIVREARARRAPRFPGEISPSPREGLVVADDASWVALDGARAIDFASRPSLRRLLAVLVRTRQRSPGRYLPARELARLVWPDDERIDPRLLLGRLHVSLSALRRLGLRDAIETRASTYRLAPTLAVHAAR